MGEELGSEENRILQELRKLSQRVGQLEEKVAGRAAVPVEERFKTHTSGLDDALGGGLPVGHVVLVHGQAGTMKTSLGLYIAAKNVEEGKEVLYISLEESRESLERTMRALGVPEEDFIVDIATMRLEHGLAEEAGDWFQILRSYLQNKLEEGLDLLVIDPINSLYPVTPLTSPRMELFRFFRFLRDSRITTLLVYEGTEFSHNEDYMADGVLEIEPRELEGGKVVLWIRCAKLRQADHSRDYHRLDFVNGRFAVLPAATGGPED